MGYSILQLPSMVHAFTGTIKRWYFNMNSREGPATNKLSRIDVGKPLSTYSHDAEVKSYEPRVKLSLEERHEELKERVIKMEEKIGNINECVFDIQKAFNEIKRFVSNQVFFLGIPNSFPIQKCLRQ